MPRLNPLARIPLFLLVMVCLCWQSSVAHDTTSAFVNVITWRIKFGANRPNDYWIDGMVQNVSPHRLTGIQLRFNVLSSQGTVLGESDAQLKLMTLLPGQVTVFAAPVELHNSRMSKMVLFAVKIQTSDEILVLKDVPFTASPKSALFRNVRRPPPASKGIGLH